MLKLLYTFKKGTTHEFLSMVIKAGQSRLVVVLNDQETDYSRKAVGARRSFAN